jgi:hypothetical protein
MKQESDQTENNAYARTRIWLNRTVAGAGITSALGDFCYETTTVVLPAFLAVLGIPAAVLGIIEGIADAVASFTKMVSGFVADKFGHAQTTGAVRLRSYTRGTGADRPGGRLAAAADRPHRVLVR